MAFGACFDYDLDTYYIWKHVYLPCKNMQNGVFPLFPPFPMFTILTSQTMDDIYFKIFLNLQ